MSRSKRLILAALPTSADVDVFGLERDPVTGNETPVNMNRTIRIQSF